MEAEKQFGREKRRVVKALMARPERFERPTPRFVVWCSIQLSYGRVFRFVVPDETPGGVPSKRAEAGESAL